jgi:serine/threonine protein phosphatase PrpC
MSDVGMRRSQNQDSFAVQLATNAEQWQKHGHVFLVADGMGAHAVGELASELASTIIPLTYSKYAGDGPVPAIEKAFQEANASIHAKGQQNRDFKGMGTTGSLLVLRPEGAWVGHVGDSRVYRIRDGQVEQLSFDHSLLWELARRQRVRPDQITGVPSNVIVRSLGPEGHVNVDIEGPHPVKKGDIYLLCSDGLSGQISPRELGAIATSFPPDEACRLLVDLANLSGGPDNITVIVVRANANIGKLSDAAQTDDSADHGDGRLTGMVKRIPWFYGALGVGAVLAAAAIGMTTAEVPGGAIVFMLAAAAIIAGIIGLSMTLMGEKTESDEKKPWKPRRRVYSHAAARIDPALLEKIAAVHQALSERMRAKDWGIDWDAYTRQVQAAEAVDSKGNPLEAFRAHCKALVVLTEVFRIHRRKEEAFEPLWDKVEGGVEKSEKE